MSIKSLPEVEDLSEVAATIEVQHHVETEGGVIVDKVFDGATEAGFGLATDAEVAAAKADEAVDPASVSAEDFAVEGDEDDLDVSFGTEAFSTYTISYYYNYYSWNVHYVATDGTELTPTMTPNFDARHQFLIYDIEGYEYDSTHLGSRTGTTIQPILRSSSRDGLYYSNNIQYINGNNWSNLNNDVYVVYKAKTAPTQGGTPVIDGATASDWPQGDSKPQVYTSSTNNGDGTNTVSLSINGGEKEFSKQTKANVIVVMDVSGSMDENLGSQSRIAVAKNAVYNMADTLLNKMDGVKMALVSFSTTASTVQGFTDNYTTYTNAVRNLDTDGGTNWEKALSVANRMAVDSDAATFVVFVTDGDPTFRVSRGDVSDSNLDLFNSETTYYYYRNDNVFGAGNGTLSQNNNIRNFNAAVTETKSILASNKNFYAIGVSEDVTAVARMVDEAGGGSSYLATDAAALEEAFRAITQSIKTTLGFGDVQITDGITELANVEMKVMQEVDPESFTDYKVTSSGQAPWDPTSEGAQLASYNKETGAVTWDMGDKFQLEDGVTYMVTFRVWPSQDAYDLIADLNNGVKVYAEGQPNSITAEERAQVQELAAPTDTAQGRYTLKTNTDSVSATYSQTS
ncbi:MAG: VWA domain-containing protein, partial [Atopobiaceae bacterium]|nr:VWA domain-containing protein [Atopobiaceae bacterium]